MIVLFIQITVNYNTSKIRIACIGNSITEITSYPIELQIKLGNNYRVENFGSSGSTILIDTYTPYIFQSPFLEAKIFLPDIVIIMLGTNDVRSDNFKSINNFVSDYLQLIKTIQNLNKQPKIILAKPPPIFENVLDLNGTNFSNVIIPLIEEVASESNLPVIDIYNALKDHPEYFPDGVHPNNEGAAIITKEVFNSIKTFE